MIRQKFLILVILVALNAVPMLLHVLAQTNEVDSTQLKSGEIQNDSTISTINPLKYSRATFKFFTTDYAILRYDAETLQLEIYALIDRSLLETEEIENGVRARYRITFKFYNNDELITGDSWERIDRTASSEERQSGQKIPELVKYRIKSGKYRIEVEVVDLIAQKYQTEGFLIDRSNFSTSDLAISDIIIASRIEKATGGEGEFEHNGLLVLPNAERVFGTNNPQVFYYTELYNLTADSMASYLVTREILDDERTVVKRLDDRQRKVPASGCVEADAFSIATLHTGSYSLMLTVTDETTGEQTAKERKFWVYRAEDFSSTYAMDDPGFDIKSMTDEEVAKELKMVRYIMKSKVEEQLKELNKEAQRLFLAKFWIANDPDKSTQNNELREEYMRRVQESNARYKGSFGQEGWTTDRGRAYLMYGEPDLIEDHPFDLHSSTGYQIWYYDHIEGGVYFVFVDRNGFGDYVQVHSTKVGELSNPNWRSLEKLGNY